MTWLFKEYMALAVKYETSISRDAVIMCSAVLLLVLLLLLVTFAYNITFHPLADVPGPRLAAISSTWLASHAKNGRLGELGRTLHSQYGPAVRVAPDQVWFNSRAAFKAIYRPGSGFEKSDYYLATALQRPHIDWRLKVHPVDTLDLLSERDMSRYRLQRRLIGPVYRAENVARYRKAIDKVLDSAVTKIHSLQGAKVDLKEWMHIISVECLGAVVLSWSPGLLKQGTDWGTSTHSYRAWRRKSVMGLFPTVAKLEMCYKIIGRVFSHVWDLTFIPPPNFRPFFPPIGRRISKRIKAMNRGSKQDHDDLAADLMRIHQEKPAFSEPYLRKMIMTNFGAGHETLASTLTSVMAMIGTHDEVPRKLSEELRSSDSITMHYLEAVIKETKRLHPVIATALPRRVPREGLHIDGVFVPAGTTVGCNPIALHRNEDICGPDPDVFFPERWLDSLDCARDMEQFSLSWGGGARTCPGRQLAEMIVQKVISRMTEEFELEVHMPDFQEMPSYFLSIMTGVSVRFLPKRKDQG